MPNRHISLKPALRTHNKSFFIVHNPEQLKEAIWNETVHDLLPLCLDGNNFALCKMWLARDQKRINLF